MESRRERLRAETAAEIKRIALKHIAAAGPASVSLRAIARDMGMTAGAIYSYYDTRDDLITALINDVYTGLVQTLEAARDSKQADDGRGRLLAWALAYRKWAIANPEEFRLLYGDPAPGYRIPEGGAAAEAERRACAGITGLVAAAWPREVSGTYRWSDFEPDFVALVRAQFPDLPPAAIALTLRVWGRMHGLVALEVYGHLRSQIHDGAKIFEAEMLDMADELGL
jgi:AcrR family transcriptional regulator